MKKIVFAGRGKIAADCLSKLAESKQDILVIPAGNEDEKRLLRDRAGENGLSLYEGKIADLSFRPDILFSVLFDKKIKEPLLSESLCVNLHLAPLPKYGGINPFYWALKSDEKEYGVTLHKMDLGFDTGDIIAQNLFDIDPDETARNLFDRSNAAALAMFLEAAPRIIDGNFSTKPQDLSKRSYFGKGLVNYTDLIDMNRPTREVYCDIRARIFPPYQGPTFSLRGQKYSITSAKTLKDKEKDFSFISSSRVIAGTKDGSLDLIVEKINE